MGCALRYEAQGRWWRCDAPERDTFVHGNDPQKDQHPFVGAH